MSDELRQEIERALNSRLVIDQAVGYVDGPHMADAVMAAVQPLVDERDRLKDEAVHYIAQRLALDEVAKHADALRVERDRLLWLHAEAVWQREQLRIEADRQWTVRRQMGHRLIDLDSELTEAVDLAHWLLAESAWRLAKSEDSRFPADWRQQIGLCESSGAAVDLVESWLPAAVEGGPADRIEWCVFYGGTDPYHSAGFELYDDEADATEHVQLYEQPAGVAKRTVRRGSWEITQAAGVSGTGTEASDVSR